MDSKTATLLGAAAALVSAPTLATAGTQEPAIPRAASYADLLTPISNPVDRLRRADAEAPPAQLIEAQYMAHHHHHHHHHHSRHWYMRHGYSFYNGAWVVRPRLHHHHHHHHHNHY